MLDLCVSKLMANTDLSKSFFNNKLKKHCFALHCDSM